MMTLLMFILGCADKEAQTEPANPIVQEPSVSEPTSEPEAPPEITSNEVGSSELYPEDEAPYRNKKRMRIKHVQDSMVLVSGGIEWNVDNTDKIGTQHAFSNGLYISTDVPLSIDNYHDVVQTNKDENFNNMWIQNLLKIEKTIRKEIFCHANK